MTLEVALKIKKKHFVIRKCDICMTCPLTIEMQGKLEMVVKCKLFLLKFRTIAPNLTFYKRHEAEHP